ncbi:phosphoesterase [Nonlabens arenilitoris]|uniref:Phosphoesterase n=1 Tax=Nonlabens arenilitoris TaxID=1217969 RepID=A0A2S7U9G1_9FLAO|nr:metallophosphoesterase [Nonlabens arenilitoris]PQJ31221.1 phosphoesterase [Nonlabens arenilitoris]
MRFIIPIILFVVFQVYSFQLIRTLSRGHWWKWIYLAATILILINLIMQFVWHPDRGQVSTARDIAVTIFLGLLAAQFVMMIVMLGEDIYRVIKGGYNALTQKQDNTSFLPSRRAFISKVGLGLAALPFGAILYGAWKGKYNYQVREYELSFDDLPDAFDGYKVTQISDIHVGSFDDKEEVKYAIDLVNKQGSDAIFFTGDLVNNISTEMHGWESIFGKLSAKDGVYSVLGNHDYGDYYGWEGTREEVIALKKANMEKLYSIQKQMGWRLLRDENIAIKRGNDLLNVVGVENIGNGRFPKYGDLKKASVGLRKSDFKILLSHDPSHWEDDVKHNDLNYHLTLSGHTHGMQFGIEIPGFIKLSPAWFVYKKWAGIYKEFGRFINVNRGFGFLGYSGRAGIWPEITVITLKKAKNRIN